MGMQDSPVYVLKEPSVGYKIDNISNVNLMTPLSLNIVDKTTVKSENTNLEVDGFKRVLYDPFNKLYICLDTSNNDILIVDRVTKLSICSYRYFYRDCAGLSNDDMIVDMCIHNIHDIQYNKSGGTLTIGASAVTNEININVNQTTLNNLNSDERYGEILGEDLQKHVKKYRPILLSILVVNSENKRGFVAKFFIDLNEAYVLDKNSLNLINLDKFVAFIDLFPIKDIEAEIAIPNTEVTTIKSDLSRTYMNYWMRPKIEELPSLVIDKMYIGKFIPDYCSLATTEDNRYVVIIGSEVTTYLNPFLTFPTCVQYIATIDSTILSVKWCMTGYTSLTFGKQDMVQPFMKGLTIYDGQYVLAQYDLKQRVLTPIQILVNNKKIEYPEHIIESLNGELSDNRYSFYRNFDYSDILPIGCTKDWRGDYIANINYPLRRQLIKATPPDTTTYTHYGYVTEWTENSHINPKLIDTIWVSFPFNEIVNRNTLKSFNAVITYKRVPMYSSTNIYSWMSVNVTDVTYSSGNNIYHNHVNYLIFSEDYANILDNTTNSLYFTGVVPGETQTKKFKLYNLSDNGVAKNISFEINSEDIPEGVTVRIENFPTELRFQEEVYFTVHLNLTEASDDTVLVDSMYQITIPLRLKYYMAWHLINSTVNDYLDSTAFLDLGLYLNNVEDDLEWGKYTLDVPFEYLFKMYKTTEMSLIFSTYPTTYNIAFPYKWFKKPDIEEDLTLGISAVTYKYFTDSRNMSSEYTDIVDCYVNYPNILNISTNYNLVTNSQVAFIINKALDKEYAIAAILDTASLPNVNNTGIIVVEYPQGNIIKTNDILPIQISYYPNISSDNILDRNTYTKLLRENFNIYNLIDTFYIYKYSYTDILSKLIYQSSTDPESLNIIFNTTYKITQLPSNYINCRQGLSLFNLDNIASIIQEKTITKLYNDISANQKPINMSLTKQNNSVIDFNDINSAIDITEIPKRITYTLDIADESIINNNDKNFYMFKSLTNDHKEVETLTTYLKDTTIKIKDISYCGLPPKTYFGFTTTKIFPCKANKDIISYWKIRIEDLLPGKSKKERIEYFLTTGDTLLKTYVYALNTTDKSWRIHVISEESSTLPLVPLCDFNYIDGNIIPPNDILRIEVIVNMSLTLGNIKYLNLIDDFVCVPKFKVNFV